MQLAACFWLRRLGVLTPFKGFWFLWWHDLLAAAFFFNLLLILLKHRLFPYPSIAELKSRREEVQNADQLDKQFSQRLSATSDLRLLDVWRLGNLLTFLPKGKKAPQRENDSRPTSSHETSDELEDTTDSRETQELKRLALFIMNEITNFHERVKK